MFGKIAVKIIFLEDEEFFYKIPFDLRTLKGEEISFSIKAKDPMIISGVYNSISIMDQGDVTKIKGVQSWLKQSELDLISIQEIDIDKKYLEEAEKITGSNNCILIADNRNIDYYHLGKDATETFINRHKVIDQLTKIFGNNKQFREIIMFYK